MKVITNTNYHNKSQISLAHNPVRNMERQYVKSVTESRIFQSYIDINIMIILLVTIKQTT